MQIYDNLENKSVAGHINAGWETVVTGSNGLTLMLKRALFKSDSEFEARINKIEDALFLVENDESERYTLIFNSEHTDIKTIRLGQGLNNENSLNDCCVLYISLN